MSEISRSVIQIMQIKRSLMPLMQHIINVPHVNLLEEHLEDEESRGGKCSAWSCDEGEEDWAALLEDWPEACLYPAGEEQGKQDCPMMK